jgi:replicative DNA helicase
MQLENNDNILKHLNPTRSIYSVLGNLCINPRALKDPEVHLAEEDFYQDFHKTVFSAINNMVYSGEDIKSITEVDIDNFLSLHPKLMKTWEDNDGIQYMRKAIEHSNIETFKINYDLLKKYALLRNYIETGVSIKDIFDFENVDLKVFNDGRKRIENMTLEDIVEYFSKKMVQLKNKWSLSNNSKNFTAGDGLDTLLDEMNEEPEFGYPFQNGFYNAIFRGMRPGKFMLRSATTGGGKTRQSLADMCSVSCSEIYDYKAKDWVSNGVSKPTLFISTELEKRELQTVMLAYITGINEDVIKNGKYSEATLKRLRYGIEVLKRAPIYAVYVDDFSISDIEGIIEQYILEKNVEYVAFDYIQMTAKLSRTMQTAFGSALREDQILVQFSGAMKLLANKYQIYIISSTQLNRNSKDTENRDTQSLRGGSATADKVDHGLMSFRATAKDHDNLKHILDQGMFQLPNFSHWVYKNRSGRTAVIIWTKMDLGTLREEVLFITDTDFNLVTDINPIDIEMTEELTAIEEYSQTHVAEYHVDF